MDKLVERTHGAITKQSISRYEKGIMRPKRDAGAGCGTGVTVGGLENEISFGISENAETS